MNIEIISDIFFSHLHGTPQEISRCETGIANYVYIVKCGAAKYVFRCCIGSEPYAETVRLLEKLSALGIPVPTVLFCGRYEEYGYIILNFIEGKDIGLVYRELTKTEKKKIAEDVMKIQKKVSELPTEHIGGTRSWTDFIDVMLDEAGRRISANGYFDVERVERIRRQKACLKDYFDGVQPAAYLDDISTKNLLIHCGRVSGIIDVDEIGYGDNLTFIALTYAALLNMECETDYVGYLLEERGCNSLEMKAFLFYSLLYCMDFMGERGTRFGDKTVEVSGEIIARLNGIYDMLWEKWLKL